MTCNILSLYLYLQVSHFSFPLASTIQEGAADNKWLHFTMHEVINKNLYRDEQEAEDGPVVLQMYMVVLGTKGM